jgi:hypothetical protein
MGVIQLEVRSLQNRSGCGPSRGCDHYHYRSGCGPVVEGVVTTEVGVVQVEGVVTTEVGVVQVEGVVIQKNGCGPSRGCDVSVEHCRRGSGPSRGCDH